jgi:uncharacterized protein (DUF488 family)
MTKQLSTIWTIGHGTRTGNEFVQMLREAGIQCLVDVRSYPGSRRNPQFSRVPLASLLVDHGIQYQWEGEGLGGFRKSKADSKNVSLKNEGFRGYADYMESAEFKQAIELLIEQAQQTRIAYMCAERLPWQCHRYLISDYLVMSGMRVVHLIAQGKTQEHTLNPSTRIQNDILIYDGKTQLNLEPL